MPLLAMLHLALLVFLVAAWPVPVSAADRRWTCELERVTFELTPSDLRAWTGDTAGPPVFSTAALLAAEKKEFDAYAEELARGLAGSDSSTYADHTFA